MLTVPQATVFVVDDDASVREALEDLLESAGWTVKSFASAQTFLDQKILTLPHCVILDLEMPELNGLELQKQIVAQGRDTPVIFLTGHGDIPRSVQAMKAGAVEFLTKPFRDIDLLDAVRQAVAKSEVRRVRHVDERMLRTRAASLTPREREVMEGVVAGRLNKQIAAELGLSEVTVKVYRGQVMRKMNVPSLADLVRTVEKLKTLE